MIRQCSMCNVKKSARKMRLSCSRHWRHPCPRSSTSIVSCTSCPLVFRRTLVGALRAGESRKPTRCFVLVEEHLVHRIVRSATWRLQSCVARRWPLRSQASGGCGKVCKATDGVAGGCPDGDAVKVLDLNVLFVVPEGGIDPCNRRVGA
jgi:hypothetical protein